MFLIRLLSKLPLSALYLISDFLFVVSFYVVRYRRRLVQKNLRQSFPQKSNEELRLIEKEFYRNLCDYSVEALKLLSISKEELSRRMVFKDNKILDHYKSKNQSILFLASHQFNWEWSMVSASINFPFAIDFIYQPVSSKMFDQLSLELRSRFGAYPIKRDEVAREFVKRKNIVKGIASVADQYPGLGRDKKYITTFLNQETAFFYGTNQLAILTQYPTLFYRMKKVKRGYYEASPVLIAEPPFEKNSEVVLENYIREVEKLIMDYPSGWLWSHNRWKKRHLKK
jgi:Kdo2-lipid IVA lauroyltransferase/acyltransferase